MKIKYFDKEHKKTNNNTKLKQNLITFSVMGFTSALMISMVVSVSLITHKSELRHEINQTPYIVESNVTYPVKDIWLLYNDQEVIKCRRETMVGNSYPPGFKLSRGIYNFYNIETNELLGYTTVNAHNIEGLSKSFLEDEIKHLNGYKYVNLGTILGYKELDEYQNIDQEFIDNFIEEKRFLGK